eukprot:s1054_g5.t2
MVLTQLPTPAGNFYVWDHDALPTVKAQLAKSWPALHKAASREVLHHLKQLAMAAKCLRRSQVCDLVQKAMPKLVGEMRVSLSLLWLPLNGDVTHKVLTFVMPKAMVALMGNILKERQKVLVRMDPPTLAAPLRRDAIVLSKSQKKKEKNKRKATEAAFAASAAEVHDLKFAIPQAKESGIDAKLISEAEEVLRLEKPKMKAREQLQEDDNAVDKLVAFQQSHQANKTCANCPARPTHVCVSFQIFVCESCRALHHWFGHKMKSISSSEWSSAEVAKLEEGGGNEGARAKWLDGWNKDIFPEPDGTNEDWSCGKLGTVFVEHVKEWIRLKYVEKRWRQPNAKPAAVTQDSD